MNYWYAGILAGACIHAACCLLLRLAAVSVTAFFWRTYCTCKWVSCCCSHPRCCWRPYTITRRTVKFPYIHMMSPDDNGPRREKYFPYESGVNTCFAPAVFNTSGIFPRYTAWKSKVNCEHRVGSNLQSQASFAAVYPLSHSWRKNQSFCFFSFFISIYY